MPIKRLNEFPEGSGSLSNDDIFIFMDDPSSGGVTKKISLSDIAEVIGGGNGGSGISLEEVQDNLGTSFLVAGSNITLDYIDGEDPASLTIGVSGFPTFQGVYLPNYSSITQGSFDNGFSGQSGISLNCTVGYELNWQAGHLKNTADGGLTSANILCDSALEFPGAGEDNMEIGASGLTFPDGSVQSTAPITLDSDSAIFCKAGDSIETKYSLAKTLTPGGNALSSTNRATLIVLPGSYNTADNLALTLDTDYVDVIGLGSVKMDRGAKTAVTINADITVTASDIRIKGISTASTFSVGGSADHIIENCIGGNNSFAPFDFNGKFTNCVGGDNSFTCDAVAGTHAGILICCVGGQYSFAGYVVSGSFKDCTGTDDCFQAYTLSGEFNGCVAGLNSFKADTSIGTNSGTFTNCEGGQYSFAGNTVSGSFKDCTGTDDCFQAFTLSGEFINCSGGEYCFTSDPGSGTISGNFINCVADIYSFRGSTISGKFTNCNGGQYSFNAQTAITGTFESCVGADDCFTSYSSLSGKFIHCAGGENCFKSDPSSGTTDGTFIDCIADISSFVGDTLSGTFKDCTGADDCFQAYTLLSGEFNGCVAGLNSFKTDTTSATTNSGTFTNCEGGQYSFAGNTVSGSFKDCTGTDDCFVGYNLGGTFTDCVGETGSFIGTDWGNTNSGTFNRCIGDSNSFAGETLSGTFLYCQLKSGSFNELTLDGGGKYRLCIDGDYNVINADAAITI